jgi:hypothetical protein
MRRLIGGLLVTAGAMVLAVGILVTVELLLASSDRQRRRRKSEFGGTAKVPAPPPEREEATEDKTAASPALLAVPAKAGQRNFTIKRTKSEVGYVYWILEGHGRYKCFVLCDTWEEAVAQATARAAEVDNASKGVAPASSFS